MKLKSHKTGNALLAAAAMGLAAAGSVGAATELSISYDQAYTGTLQLSGAPGNLGSGGESAYLTAFQATYVSGTALPFGTSNPFYTFCVDILPNLVNSGTWTGGTFPPNNPNGNTINYVPNGIQEAASIYNAYVSQADISTASGEFYGAALQLAIWNALYDTDNKVESGTFKVGSVSGGSGLYTSSAVVTEADTMLGTALNANLTSTFWNATDPSNNQDLIGPQFETGFVPEPGTYAAAASALGCLCLLGFRRTQKRS